MKEKLRKKYQLIRKEISNKEYLDKVITNKLLNNSYIQNANLILCYVSLEEEINTLEIINNLLKDKIVAVPKIENGIMNFYRIKSLNDLKKGTFNVLEPITNELVIDFTNSVSITPGICFTYAGFRIGYGKGYYDKFYAKNPNIYKIGLCYKECIIDDFIKDSNDIKVDDIITD